MRPGDHCDKNLSRLIDERGLASGAGLGDLPSRERVLYVCALFGWVSVGQAARLAGHGTASPPDARPAAVIEEMTLLLRWLRCRHISLPTEWGGGAEMLLGLTGRGKRALERVAPEVSAWALLSPASGVHASRVAHNLLCVEGVLEWANRTEEAGWTVGPIIPEDLLRGVLQSSETRSWDSLPDYVLCYGASGRENRAQFEAARRIKSSSIRRKSDHSIWLVPSRAAADRVQLRRGLNTEVIVVPGVSHLAPSDDTFSPEFKAVLNDSPDLRPQRRRRIGMTDPPTPFELAVLRTLDALVRATAGAVAGILQTGRTGVSRVLRRLEEAGLVSSVTVVARGTGAPTRLYSRERGVERDLGTRLHSAWVSHSVAALTARGYGFESYSDARGVLYFRRESREERCLIAVVDRPLVPVERVVAVFRDETKRMGGGGDVIVVAPEARRAELLRRACPDAVYDFSRRGG